MKHLCKNQKNAINNILYTYNIYFRQQNRDTQYTNSCKIQEKNKINTFAYKLNPDALKIYNTISNCNCNAQFNNRLIKYTRKQVRNHKLGSRQAY